MHRVLRYDLHDDAEDVEPVAEDDDYGPAVDHFHFLFPRELTPCVHLVVLPNLIHKLLHRLLLVLIQLVLLQVLEELVI